MCCLCNANARFGHMCISFNVNCVVKIQEKKKKKWTNSKHSILHADIYLSPTDQDLKKKSIAQPSAAVWQRITSEDAARSSSGSNCRAAVVPPRVGTGRLLLALFERRVSSLKKQLNILGKRWVRFPLLLNVKPQPPADELSTKT